MLRPATSDVEKHPTFCPAIPACASACQLQVERHRCNCIESSRSSKNSQSAKTPPGKQDIFCPSETELVTDLSRLFFSPSVYFATRKHQKKTTQHDIRSLLVITDKLHTHHLESISRLSLLPTVLIDQPFLIPNTFRKHT